MKNHKKRSIREKGITLVALVVTVIVLLVLAGVTISLVLGDNGAINRAEVAFDTQTKATIEQEIELARGYAETYRQTKTGNYYDEIANYLNNSNALNLIGKITTKIMKKNGERYIVLTVGNSFFYKITESGKETVLDLETAEELATSRPLELSNVKNLTNSEAGNYYGEDINYTSTLHPNIKWQFFYTDTDNIYIIASDYVPNTELPCNGVTIGDTTYGETDLIPVSNSEYKARFTSDGNDGVLTEGTIYRDGSASSAFNETEGSNYLTENYLKWVKKYPKGKGKNICVVAYMMDTNKWSSFADGIDGAYAIGGPTIEMFSLSWNAISEHLRMPEFNGYNVSGYYLDATKYGFFGTETSMWYIKTRSQAEGYWIASPTSAYQAHYVCAVSGQYSWIMNYSYNSAGSGFRPLVAIPKTSIV
ncbi:MAG: hypothetical protein IKG14_01475 [Clostridia bacterium]|nr:hypothetical protein [Clostridia bacterium]